MPQGRGAPSSPGRSTAPPTGEPLGTTKEVLGSTRIPRISIGVLREFSYSTRIPIRIPRISSIIVVSRITLFYF